MAPSSSPTVRRRRLAAELHRLRQASKLTIEQVAEQLEWSPGKVSKSRTPASRSCRETRGSCSTSTGSPKARNGTCCYRWPASPANVAGGSSTARQSQSGSPPTSAWKPKPGHLRLPGRDRARPAADAALCRRTAPGRLMNATEDEIERHVAVRMERQARLKQPDAPQLWVVLNEAVIRRIVGERAIMHEQLTKLTEAASAPNITLQVLPFSAGAHASMDSAFWILSFDPPTDGDIVYFEHPTCSLYLEKADEVARYRLVYEHLRAASLSLDESRRLIARSAEDLA